MTNERSVRWDLAAIATFAASAVVWLSLLSHDPADDLGPFPSVIASVYQQNLAAYPANETIQNRCGYVGALVSDVLLQLTGIGAYLVAALMILSGVVMLRQQPWASPLGRSIGWTLTLVAICCLPYRLGIAPPISVPIDGGGYIGALCNTWMDRHLAHGGALILVTCTLVGGLLLSTEYALVRYLGFAATGGTFALRYVRFPQWNWRRAATSGTFSPSRSDLPKSLTMRQSPSPLSNNQTINPAHANPAPHFPIEFNDPIEEPIESGPAIKIGRRSDTNLSPEDFAAQSKSVGRTDLSFPKANKPANTSLASFAASLFSKSKPDAQSNDELLESDDETAAPSSNNSSRRSSSVISNQSSSDDEETAEYDEEEEYDYEDEVHAEEEEDSEPIVPEPAARRNSGRNVSMRTDSSHMPQDQGPKVTNRRNKKDKEKELDESAQSEKEDLMSQLDDTKLPEGTEEYVLPGLDLLTESDEISYDEQTEEVKRKAKVLEQSFANFGLNVRVVEIETGPVIAQYEIELEAGLRLSKITGLADDLAIALRVPSVRIVAPIPGKNTVGIEVPNEQRQVVRMREVIEESGPQIRKMKIPLFLGKDVSGKALTVDLASLPHLLIAGRTGTGKSVCLNSIISSILMTRRPDEVRMLMIDPKMVELSGYGRLPHLMHPVVTDMRKAEAILAWAVDKMEERYSLLARAGVRHITSYNQLGREELHERLRPESPEDEDLIPDHLPFIVIVADEMADLMMTAGKEVEAHIIRLAQKSRAVGIHLILATQKPTVDVITGLIKSNLPARISFQVASRTDSRVVLDENGADKLLGNGDMLFLWPGTSALLRGQGTYLSDDEINAVVDHCSTGEQNFVQELVQLKVNAGDDEPVKPGSFKKRDDLYEAAVDIVVREGRGSCSLLQRALGIGYGRAARLIDFMSEDGIVGQYNGSQAREVIITLSDWETMRAGADGASEAPTRSRSNKIRRDDSWEDTPKKPKAKKSKSRPSDAFEAEDAVVASSEFDESEDENLWGDEE